MLRTAGAKLRLDGPLLAHKMLQLARLARVKELACFVQAGADVNVRDVHGRTLLHWCNAEGLGAAQSVVLAQAHVDTTAPDPLAPVDA